MAGDGQLELGFRSAEIEFERLDRSEASIAALDAAAGWRTWPGPFLWIVGPDRCGLSSISRAWANHAAAHWFAPTDERGLSSLSIAPGDAIVLDDADRISEETLLSLLNQVVEAQARCLLTGHAPPNAIATQSKDLQSRLAALPVVTIGEPDEAMVRLRLKSLLRDRHIRIEDDVLDYLCIRLDRAYGEVEAFALALAQAAVDARRPPTIPLARDVLIDSGRMAPATHDPECR